MVFDPDGGFVTGDGDPETFRIKIWEEVNRVEHVIYDNGADQPVGGGSIIVHKV